MMANIYTTLQRLETKVDALQGGRLAAEPIDEKERAAFQTFQPKTLRIWRLLKKN
ncbi:unnamed protein product [Callosobruchus maculatus]|uniref:Uncharacterized protein n=1 Tax=Callosobruchus maculatus TaxID=64391 RepID=A0A653DE70_CALMS|nr:unnamed protein product [Callosobruchus maculatus]